MNREFKKSFFMSLMAVLLIVSNLIGMKLTNFFDIIIGVDFITFPFTFLCTLLILNLGDKKDAYGSILIASIIQLLITISYTFASSLGTQSIMPDSSLYVNELFKVNQLNILASVLAFIVSHCALIYIYDNFKNYGKELYGIVIGLLGSMFLNSVIYLFITLSGYETIFVINLLLSNVIVDIIMVAIIIILYNILKDKEITEVDKPKEVKKIPEKKKVEKTVVKPVEVKKTSNTNTKTKRNYSKPTKGSSKSSRSNSKRTTISKKTVKKTNK